MDPQGSYTRIMEYQIKSIVLIKRREMRQRNLVAIVHGIQPFKLMEMPFLTISHKSIKLTWLDLGNSTLSIVLCHLILSMNQLCYPLIPCFSGQVRRRPTIFVLQVDLDPCCLKQQLHHSFSAIDGSPV
jgi:hypothetical protein